MPPTVPPTPPPPPLCQVAWSTTDLRRTHAWYRGVLGCLPSGGTRTFRGPLASRVQGLPHAASTCWWLVDAQDFFQLEMFEFKRPRARPFAGERRPCDVGYTTVGFHVADFDAVAERLAAAGTPPLSEPVGSAGARRVCARDPEGVLVEVMEDDPRASRQRARPLAGVPVAARSVTLSVPDLESSRHFFVDVLGLQEAAGVALHGPEHEALWGLSGAGRHSVLLWAEDVLVEIVQYDDPVGAPWPDGYRISDRGLLNVAFGFHDKAAFDAAHHRCLAAGAVGNWRPLNLGAWAVVYVNDEQGFSVELLFVRKWYEGAMGFRPKGRSGNAGPHPRRR